MSCWKWFNKMLDDAGVKVTEENRDRIDTVISEYIAMRSSDGRCSTIPSEASGQISADRTLRDELIERLRKAEGPR
jgi:hypothetical protein